MKNHLANESGTTIKTIKGVLNCAIILNFNGYSADRPVGDAESANTVNTPTPAAVFPALTKFEATTSNVDAQTLLLLAELSSSEDVDEKDSMENASVDVIVSNRMIVLSWIILL